MGPSFHHSVVVAQRLTHPEASGILVPWPGINPGLQSGLSTTGSPGKSHTVHAYRLKSTSPLQRNPWVSSPQKCPCSQVPHAPLVGEPGRKYQPQRGVTCAPLSAQWAEIGTEALQHRFLQCELLSFSVSWMSSPTRASWEEASWEGSRISNEIPEKMHCSLAGIRISRPKVNHPRRAKGVAGHDVQSVGFGGLWVWAHPSALPLATCVTLGKSLNLSEPISLTIKWEW